MATLKEMALEAENSSRALKFETLVEDIDKVIKKPEYMFSGLVGIGRIMAKAHGISNGSLEKITPLCLVYDYEELNTFGKIIMKKATIKLEGTGDNRYVDPWYEAYGNKQSVGDKIKIDASKDFIGYCRAESNRPEAYKFIFWTLMVISVDDTNADEKLSFICDFARMLKITDDEMMDIVYTIKTIYNEVDKEYEFKTETVPAILGSTFNLYGN